MMIYLGLFFFNDPATTESYTYGHTLALHDALPICSAPVWRYWRKQSTDSMALVAKMDEHRREQPTISTVIPALAGISPARYTDRVSSRPAPGRSEENTSELQSLMRISYAVFCLKKKTKTYHTTHTVHSTTH